MFPTGRDTNETYLGENGLIEEQEKNSKHMARNDWITLLENELNMQNTKLVRKLNLLRKN